MTSTSMEWRRCVKYPDYDISECGDLRRSFDVSNQPGRRIRGTIDADGCIRYGVRDRDGRKRAAHAHKLVIEAFIGLKPTPEHQVAHNNGSRLHNVPSNLRWALCRENLSDRETHGTEPKGVRNGRATITDDDVRYIRERYRQIKLERGDVSELDEKFNLCRAHIIRIARGVAWSHVK